MLHLFFYLVQANPVNTDTEGAMKSGRVDKVYVLSIKENVRAFFPQGQSKLSVIMRYLY